MLQDSFELNVYNLLVLKIKEYKTILQIILDNKW